MFFLLLIVSFICLLKLLFAKGLLLLQLRQLLLGLGLALLRLGLPNVLFLEMDLFLALFNFSLLKLDLL